jgi:RNA polymerase sigma-70 factor (ECF subfamily)
MGKDGDTEVDDSKIIDLLFERSEQAIAALSQKYEAVCNAVARNILKNSLDAEECVNDSFLAIWNTIPPRKPNPLLTYICRIVRNLSIKKYHANTALKRNSFYDAALDELEDCLASPANVENELAAKELTLLLDSFLDTLDKENRMMFVRRYWYSDSISDIAARFQISSNNVTVRLFRTRNKLQIYLRKAGFEI